MRLTDINDIKKLLSRHGFRFSKSMGQNFLTAAWVPEDIAEAAQLDEDTGVLEVGPGIGCLTEQLALRAGKVVAVELDNALRPVLSQTLAGKNNVEIIFGDVLKQDIKGLVSEKMQGLRPVVCANLPYNVTSPLITAFLEAECFDSVTVMIQREVAKRICAKPATADYGAFTVLVNWYAEPDMLFEGTNTSFKDFVQLSSFDKSPNMGFVWIIVNNQTFCVCQGCRRISLHLKVGITLSIKYSVC